VAKVLVVDDNAANRELVATLLKHRGHEPLEAADGADALDLVRAERPALVISDVLMPTMDGYEFVRSLRADPALAATEVVFYTAHYRERDARNLARACGVSRVLVKPCDPEDILAAIDEGLADARTAVPPPLAQEFDREHLRLMADKLAEKVAELEATNARLAALSEINVQLASELDPGILLEKVCRAARDLIGARYAILCVRARKAGDPVFFATSGVGPAFAAVMKPPRLDGGPLGPGAPERRSRRFDNPGGDPVAAGLPPGFPRVRACLAAPVASLTSVYGWICLGDKLGGSAFSDEDERLLSILAAQVGRVYENGILYHEVRHHAARLQVEVTERKVAEVRIQRQNRVHALLSGISALIVRVRDRDELARRACRLAVDEGRFQLAWIGWLDPPGDAIVPGAWAGEEESFARLTRFPLAGPDRVSASVASRQPVAIDIDAQSDGVPYRDEMLGRDFHSFAGLPLVVGDRAVGYFALYTDEAGFFDAAEMQLLSELADHLSFALDHMDKEARLRTLERPR
jgi:CheY-like chemotaxis protein/GAF domain-containing protein